MIPSAFQYRCWEQFAMAKLSWWYSCCSAFGDEVFFNEGLRFTWDSDMCSTIFEILVSFLSLWFVLLNWIFYSFYSVVHLALLWMLFRGREPCWIAPWLCFADFYDLCWSSSVLCIIDSHRLFYYYTICSFYASPVVELWLVGVWVLDEFTIHTCAILLSCLLWFRLIEFAFHLKGNCNKSWIHRKFEYRSS